jgi:serine/threonine protein kinase
VLDPSLAVDAALEEQFLHEARTIAAAEHPHIVPLYSANSSGGLLYLVMRLLPGQSLEDRIAGGKLPAAEAARIALECARALAAAHAVGVVHRDIKPGNILLDTNGNATVTDFGIALVTSRPARELVGSTSGTPHYMSPEQSLGERVDGRSDVYALGVVLYEMLTGTLPFPGRSVTEVIAKHISAPIPRVSEREPETRWRSFSWWTACWPRTRRRDHCRRAGEGIDRGEHAGWTADTLAGSTSTLEAPRNLPGDRRRERGTVIVFGVRIAVQ